MSDETYTHICTNCDEPVADVQAHSDTDDCDPDCMWPISDLRELLSRAGLALVPAVDVPTPISDETLRHLTECANAWEPEARLLGNVTALELRAFCAELAQLRADAPSPEERAEQDDTENPDYCRGYTEGSNAAVAELAYGRERDSRVADATDKLRAAVEKMAPVTAEERAVLEASLAFPEHLLGSSATLTSGHHRQLAENLSWAWEQAVLRLHEARRAAKEAKGG